jgi:adenosylcobinamide-GDP ribazoletransferase
MKMLFELRELKNSFLGALNFYTVIPLPRDWVLDFQRIARFAPLIGILLGVLLGLEDWLLELLEVPVLTRSVLVVAVWVLLTGGLHLDGAIDTADGLAVTDSEKRLIVMRDSVTGAFGVMAGAILLFLKSAALTDLKIDRFLGLMMAAGWGRWGQLMAIVFYPYLRDTGKGSLHQGQIQPLRDISLGLCPLLALSTWQICSHSQQWWIGVGMGLGGSAIALLTGFWFKHQLGGHTGDTYGATVEWTEALVLCLFTTLL